MEVTNASELLFTPDDILSWATFLNSQAGRRLIPKAAESAPRLLAKGDTNEVLINHGAVLGFSAAIQALLDLAVAPQADPKSVDLFPNLEDNSQWTGPSLPKQ